MIIFDKTIKLTQVNKAIKDHYIEKFNWKNEMYFENETHNFGH